MMTLQGMADHRFTSVSLSTNVFLGEIIYLRPSLPLNAKNSYDQLHTSLERTGSWLPFQKLELIQTSRPANKQSVLQESLNKKSPNF